MNYYVDMSRDFENWEQYKVGGNLCALVCLAKTFTKKKFEIVIWDETDRKVWVNGDYTPYFKASRFEREFRKTMGASFPCYQSTVAL